MMLHVTAAGKEDSSCAMEGETCTCTGTVYYGPAELHSLEQLLAGGAYAARESKGNIDCNNIVFGDPIGGVFKHCICLPGTASQQRRTTNSRPTTPCRLREATRLVWPRGLYLHAARLRWR